MKWTLLASTAAAAFASVASAIQLPIGYDNVWKTQSKNSAGSMPLGGGGVGLNVWAEAGYIYFYIAQNAAFDENNSLLKLGRVRLSMDPNPFAVNSSMFEQRLNIIDGYITFQGDYNTTLTMWVDVSTSGIHVELEGDTPMNLTAGLESWRTSGYTMVENEQQQTSWGVIYVPEYIPLPYQYPDTVEYADGGVLSYHHNTEAPLFDFQIKQQGLQDPESYFNPMTNNTFGVFMYSPQLKKGKTSKGKYISTNYTSFNLVSKTMSKSFDLYVGVGQNQTTDVSSWTSTLVSQTKALSKQVHSTTIAWWNAFWDRSWIIINPDAGGSDPGFQVGKNYQYFRYMMGCNAYGKFPTRFNGGLFTFDPVLVESDTPFTPDYRKWSGGTFTAQNQRLLYWPLLKTGDWDIMHQEFNYYNNISPNNRKLGQLYFGLDVGLTSEQIDNTGLPNVYEYDAQEYSANETRTYLYPDGIDFNNYLSWLQDTANEFADQIILYKSVYGDSIQEWLPFVEYQLAWYDEFYQKRNGLLKNGTLIIYPASGAETYKLAYNPASTVSGLVRTITDLLDSGVDYVKGNTTYYEEYRARVPQTPLIPCPGATSLTCIAPALNYSFTENTEPVALYPVFPWSEYGLGQPTNLSYAYDAYFNDSESGSFHGDPPYGWRQDQIWWARMGLTDLVTTNSIYRFADSTTYRFSAFKGPNYDWSPDINHYGSGAIGLQEQLLQTFAHNNTQIRLLPAWPANWTGSFKLLAPQQTVVQGTIEGLRIPDLSVTPASRMSDVTVGTPAQN
ncbi:hypothetical protein BDY17DRAFT_318808 [Neohortaea acidophila]|uniref:DUF5703 domain-containing protein n=1 Tax=Neohortaea acidophila TaxID=245834 RepID=A0A6A6PH86_9PEZI|nr:uncharacterized protein BDY17DRAFT_318808 [Neohortaea acidophila]KAF2479378.1 hypothetical protein BDY17DRAFT_318808 [Neohortaea acidophila]